MSIIRIYVSPVLLLGATLSIIISGCPKNDASLPISSTPTTQTLTWDAPINYTNGDGLADAEIKEYKVYYSSSHITQPSVNFYPIFFDPNSSVTPTKVNIKDIIPQATGTYYFVVTSVDKNGVESDFSNEVIKVIK
jgi:fibronectin type 3 domain-containing protein